jgi:outer membrane protein OmpA-like peptidoglycan-associated protein
MKLRKSSKNNAYAVLLSGATLLAGCGGVIEFQGQKALAVQGEPPPPPPPPKPEPPKPPEPPPRVEVRDNKIEIHEKIQFEVAKATILEQSFGLLNEIADVIKKNPHIKKIAIEGYASAEGDAKMNLKLSDDRAKSVMKYLVDHGVEKERVTAKGFGVTKPIATNDTDEGREKNRRVEFNIIEQDVKKRKVEIDAKTGKEKLVEEKIVTEKKEEPPTPEMPKDAAKDAAAKDKAAKDAAAKDKGSADAAKKAADAAKKAADTAKKAADTAKKAADTAKKAADDKSKPPAMKSPAPKP